MPQLAAMCIALGLQGGVTSLWENLESLWVVASATTQTPQNECGFSR
jgi:hypothetical protein